MEPIQLACIRFLFEEYTRPFLAEADGNDRPLRLKVEHSARVAANCLTLARSHSAEEQLHLLAESAGILHDIARFRQYNEFRTFNDGVSFDHGKRGREILQEIHALEMLEPEERQTILTAVECHNRKVLPEIADERTAVIARMVRDADKMDILDTISRYFVDRRSGSDPAVELDMPDTPGYNPDFAARVLRGETSDYNAMRNLNDFKFILLTWIFDMHFHAALQHVRENGFLERILSTLPDDETVRAVGRHLGQELERRLAAPSA